jgi:hypothetical protein
MSFKKQLLFTLIVLILVSLACEYLPGPEPSLSTEDTIATSVAGTLAAGEEEPGEEPAASPEPPPLLRVAFVKDGDVWYWEEGGVPIQLTTLGDAVKVYLSDDGQVAAFVREISYESQEIYAVNTDGTNQRVLVSLADFAGMVLPPPAPGGSAAADRLGPRDSYPGFQHPYDSRGTRFAPAG